MHPVLDLPFFRLHPCGTAELMALLMSRNAAAADASDSDSDEAIPDAAHSEPAVLSDTATSALVATGSLTAAGPVAQSRGALYLQAWLRVVLPLILPSELLPVLPLPPLST